MFKFLYFYVLELIMHRLRVVERHLHLYLYFFNFLDISVDLFSSSLMKVHINMPHIINQTVAIYNVIVFQ